MARKYSRDKNGRFASSSAGGATKRGNRLTGKAGKQGRAGGNLDALDTGKRSSVPKGTVAGSRSAQDRSRVDRLGVSMKKSKNMGAAQRSANTRMKNKAAAAANPAPAAAAKPAKMSKAPANKAKAAYKSATSQVRELKMYRGGKSDKTVKSAQAKVKRMESKRGVTGRKK